MVISSDSKVTGGLVCMVLYGFVCLYLFLQTSRRTVVCMYGFVWLFVLQTSRCRVVCVYGFVWFSIVLDGFVCLYLFLQI